MAERGVTISVNTSANLRLRSGIAPVPAFLKHGTRFALGLDGTALDDDQDALRDRYDAWSLLEVYERAHAAHIEKNAKIRSDMIGERSDSGTKMNHEIAAGPERRTVAEFARRGARL